MRRFWLWLLALVGCAPTTYTHGVPNLAQVDSTLNIWRSGQPTTPEAWVYLKSLGIKRVVKLNYEPIEGSDDGARAAGLEVELLPMQPEGDQDIWDDIAGTFVKPNPVTVTEAIRYLANGNVLVHCTHGQDRTGFIVGKFRMRWQAWTRDDAWDEMIAHGFHPELLGLTTAWMDPD